MNALVLSEDWTCAVCGAQHANVEGPARDALSLENRIGWSAEALSRKGRALVNVSIPRRRCA
jgi:hypothetical protein